MRLPASRTRSRRARSVLPLLGLAAALAACGPPATRSGLEPLPETDLSAFEAPVREQIATAKEAVEHAAGDDDDGALAEAWGELARRLHAYELHDAAAAGYRNALRLAPGDFRWSYHLAILYQATGELAEAAEQLEAALEKRPEDLPARLRLGGDPLHQGALPAGPGELDRALQIDPECALAHYFLGHLATAAGDPATAASRYERALALQPRASAVHAQLAVAYSALGDSARAESHLERRGGQAVRLLDPLALELGELNVGAVGRIRRGARAQVEGDLATARAEYRKAVAADPDNPEARRSLGSILAQLGETGAAIQEYRAALEITGDEPLVLANLGALLVTAGERVEGVQRLERALELDPTLANAHLALGQARLLDGRPAAAEPHYRSVLARDAANVAARLGLARALAGGGRPQEALAELRSALDRDPAPRVEAALRQELGGILAGTGRLDPALAELGRALELDPGLSGARFVRANLLARDGRYAEAADEYRLFLERQPDHVAARLGEATVLALSGRFGAATESLARGIERTGGDANLQHALARLLVTAPEAAARDPRRALELSRQALTRLQSLEAAATVALALAADGRCAEAVERERELLAECRRRGESALAGQLERRLGHFESTGACLAPWAA